MEKRKKKKRVMSILGKVYVVLLFLFIYAPVFVMIAFSFNDSHANVVWSGFTTKYYVKLFSDSGIWEVLGTTLLIAVISTLIGLVVGTTGAVGLRNEIDYEYHLFSDCNSGNRACGCTVARL